MTTLIDAQNIKKSYGSIQALQSIDLKIDQSKITTLLGPNGSGKTTLLKIFAGLEKPTQGRIIYNGTAITDNNRHTLRQKATMVFQKTFFFNTTVYNNIAYGLKLREYSKNDIKKKVREALELVGMENFEKRMAKKLSGGEQQRISLARALVIDTQLLLLDEPTVNIDPKNASIIEEIISAANRERKITVVMATHNFFQAEVLSDRIALISGGRLMLSGTPIELLRDPSTNLKSIARLENVFSGNSKILQEGTSLIEVDDGVRIEAAIRKSGSVTVYIRPEEIILSKKSLPSSARNIFKGKITALSDFGSIVKLRVNVGTDFVVQITKRSFIEMQLSVDKEVFLTFKASAVHLI